MSLIEDALKKQQEEMNNGKRQQPMTMAPPAQSPNVSEVQQPQAPAAQTAEQPATPTPPEEQSATTGKLNKNLIKGVLAGGLFLGIVVVLLFQLGIFGSKPEPPPKKKTPPATTAGQKPSSSAPATNVAKTKPVTPSNATVQPVPQKIDVDIPPENTAAAQAGTATASKTGDAPTSVKPVTIDIKPRPALTPVPVAIKEPIIWPELKVTAIMHSAGGHGTAIINSNLVSEGQSVDGVDILSISTRHGIKVSYQGETKIIKK